ncbi:C4-dicarboxylate ABC transporter [Intestinimonas massiliensis]|uniref:C4-dicarboxylate ABC transporter n=1 Tax=Intestinimonas massiliensis (ex Afouda et al. 2020) TaxID=1673721 RepID=A0AAW5JWK2_9FIRM|nr:C4-dicarboxylate ABC transporter [Intestinimonas massiliensis (ex Afouda et al. 2020)]MCQ4771694.1 C4-dicarboxylate ABC transporter [Intestinimonas massiliensis (ex Afouda et al. 2020)]
MITGIIVVVIFIVMAALMMSKKLPALLALPLMAVLIGIAGGLPLKGDEGILTFVLSTGATKLVGTYVAILFSCWLSQILYRTGVTDTIIKKAAELGGDKPFVVSIALCVVTTFLFTVLFGTGAVAMVGAVVLPILLSVGVPPIVACNAFLAAMCGGYCLNPANISAIANITGVSMREMTLCAAILCAVCVVFFVAYLAWNFKKNGMKFAFAAPVEEEKEAEKRPHLTGVRGLLACATPLVVVLVMLIFRLDAIPIFLIGIVWAIVFTVKGRWNKYSSMLVQCCYEGFKDGAPTAGLMFGIGMIINAMTAPTTQAAIKPFMEMITPRTAVALVIFVCVLAPLGLYRGPFNLMGLGAGLAASMVAVNAVPVAALSAVFYAAYRWPSQSCPTSTQVVWASNFVGYDPVTTTNKVFLANWVVTAVTVVIMVALYF